MRLPSFLTIIFINLLISLVNLVSAKVFDLSNFRIALVQMDSSSKEVAWNLSQIETWVKQAASNHAEIVVFPELSITGYEVEQPAELAETIQDNNAKFIANLSKTYSIVILAGMIERDKNSKLYITQIVTQETGTIDKYRKTHLGPTKEALVFEDGKQLPVFKMQDSLGNEITFAIALCYDTHFPEIFSIYSLKGAQIVFTPHASHVLGQARIALWDKYLGARAYDNTYYIAEVNHVYQKEGKSYGGGSAVWSYTSDLEAYYAGNDENIFYHDLDINTLNTKRNNSSVFYTQSRKNELYIEQLIEQLKIMDENE